MYREIKTAKFNAGKYVIIDPCYVLHDEWSELCGLFFADKEYDCNEGEFILKDGRRFFIGSTAYGDGYYPDNKGNYYGVDAGCIGIININDIDESNSMNDINLGTIHTFETDFEVSIDNGIFKFDDIIINTREFDDEEFDEEDEY